ncbi:MAG: carbohydrate porin [Tepidisphaeraceae bacterium]
MRFLPQTNPSSAPVQGPAAPATQPSPAAEPSTDLPAPAAGGETPASSQPSAALEQPVVPAPQPLPLPATTQTDGAPTAPQIMEHPLIASSQPGDMARPSLEEAVHVSATTTQSADTTAPSADTQPAGAAAGESSAPADADDHLSDHWLAAQRGRLADRGIVIDALLATYFGDNFSGGATTSHAGAAYEFNLNFTLDSSKLLGYDGGTLFVNFRTQDGLEHPLDGSFGDTSHLDEPQLTAVSEIWYQQTLFADKLRLKLGKIDANEDFAFVQNGGEFLNDFASYSATIASLPTDPDPALGALAFYTINDHFYVGAGVFDGSLQQGVPTGSLGPNTGFRSTFLIGEAGAKWTLPGGRDGRLALGGWRQTGSIPHLDDGGHDTSAQGPYATFDQTLWRANPDQDDDKRGIAMFALAGYADPRLSQAAQQFSGGVKWTGLIPSRPDDIVGLGAGYIGFSQADDAGFDHSAQTTIEAFYKIQLKPWFSIEPDLQFVNDPDGIASQHNAVIGTIQMLVDF